MPRKIWNELRALLEPFVVPAGSRKVGANTYVYVTVDRAHWMMNTPLRDNNAAIPHLEALPHPTEVLSAHIDHAHGERLGLAPVRDKAPPHRVHDECGILRFSAANHGGISGRRNVVAGRVSVLLHPLINAKCGITVYLLDLIRLVLARLERSRKKYFHVHT